MFKFIKSMWWFIKKNWYRYVLVLFFGLLTSVITLIPTWIVGNLTDAIEAGSVTSDYLIYQILIPYIIVIVGVYGVALIKRTCMNHLTTTLYYSLQNRYMDSILSQDAGFFNRFQAGDLLTRALGDINQIKFSGGNRLLNIMVESTTVIVTFILMITIDPLLAIACFVPLTSIVILNIIFKTKVTRNWKEVREKSSEMGNVVLESITNAKTVRAYSKEEDTLKKNLKASEIVYETEKKNLKVNIVFEPTFNLVVMLSTLVCFALGAYFYYIGRITQVSSLVKFYMYLGLFQQPLTSIGNMITNFYQSLISADRLNEVYDSKSEVTEGPLMLNELESIEYKDFTYRYASDIEDTLKDISIKINKGETIGIVGKTGSGKSTLARMLLRQHELPKNSLFINGHPIEEYNKESVRNSISYIPQEHILFSRSVYENVMLGNMSSNEEDAKEAIRYADFEKDIPDLENGLETIVGEYGVTLSGGQKQRLSIARAFLKNSEILIMDDSLSAVDGKTEANIIKSLNLYRDGKTNIIITHRLSAVVNADMIYVLDNGRVAECGNHASLMAKKGWYYTQYNEQLIKEVSGNEEN